MPETLFGKIVLNKTKISLISLIKNWKISLIFLRCHYQRISSVSINDLLISKFNFKVYLITFQFLKLISNFEHLHEIINDIRRGNLLGFLISI